MPFNSPKRLYILSVHGFAPFGTLWNIYTYHKKNLSIKFSSFIQKKKVEMKCKCKSSYPSKTVNHLIGLDGNAK